MCLYVCVCLYVCARVCAFVSVCVCVLADVCVCVCVSICEEVFIGDMSYGKHLRLFFKNYITLSSQKFKCNYLN